MVDVIDTAALRRWIDLASDALNRHQAEINALNVFPVPDGDTGTNMALTVAAGAQAVAELPVGSTLAELADTVSAATLAGARGNSGIILSQYLRAFMQRLVSEPVVSTSAFAAAVQDAFDAAYGSVGEPQEGTILSVARAVAQNAGTFIANNPALPLEDLVSSVASTAQAALDRTPAQLPVLARAGVVDAGGRGLVVLLESLVELITGTRIDTVPEVLATPRLDECALTGGVFEVIYLLETSPGQIDALRQDLSSDGDSVVIAGADDSWSVHVHTDDVGAAIEAGLAVGRPSKIRITDLRGSVTGVLGDSDSLMSIVDAVDPGHMRTLGRGLVAVAHGPGMVELLESSGVQVVRAYGRIAPSTAEILAAIKKCQSSEIVLMPSSSGIKPAAEAAADLVREQDIRIAVIPTRSIVQTLAAVAVHNAQARFEDEVVAMAGAATATHYGGVSISTRDAMTSAGRCSVGDVLGIIEGDVVEIGDSVPEVAHRLLSRLLSTGGELLTIVRGEEADPLVTSALISRIRREHPGLEVMDYDGGQPVWQFIVGVE